MRKGGGEEKDINRQHSWAGGLLISAYTPLGQSKHVAAVSLCVLGCGTCCNKRLSLPSSVCGRGGMCPKREAVVHGVDIPSHPLFDSSSFSTHLPFTRCPLFFPSTRHSLREERVSKSQTLTHSHTLTQSRTISHPHPSTPSVCEQQGVTCRNRQALRKLLVHSQPISSQLVSLYTLPLVHTGKGGREGGRERKDRYASSSCRRVCWGGGCGYGWVWMKWEEEEEGNNRSMQQLDRGGGGGVQGPLDAHTHHSVHCVCVSLLHI